MQAITPFLWFDSQAEQAAKHYVSIFPRSKIDQVTRYGPAGPGKPGSVMTVDFRLNGQRFTALNGGPIFKFNESISFVVHCKDQKEIDHYWRKLSRGGSDQQCGWLKDRYGVSWQIVPVGIARLLSAKEPARAQRVGAALMKMVKLDLAALERAYKG